MTELKSNIDFAKFSASIIFLGLPFLFFLMAIGVVGISYPRSVENNPLNSPVRVLSYQNDVLELEDGRRIKVEFVLDEFAESLAESGNEIELQESGYGTEYEIYGKHRRFICGLPWSQPILIPLIPCDIPKYDRRMIGYGDRTRSSK